MKSSGQTLPLRHPLPLDNPIVARVPEEIKTLALQLYPMEPDCQILAARLGIAQEQPRNDPAPQQCAEKTDEGHNAQEWREVTEHYTKHHDRTQAPRNQAPLHQIAPVMPTYTVMAEVQTV